jgi:hypothetical protein
MRNLILAAGSTAVLLAACGQRSETTPPATGVPPAAPADAASTGGAEPSAALTESREFRDWRAVCDNGNACVAWTGGDGGWVRVALEAGPDAAPTVTAGSWTVSEPGEVAADLTLRIDGRNIALRAGPKDAANVQVSTARARDIAAALVAARSVALAAGGKSEAVPAAGAAAALLWIDERQGRLGTTTALVRRGDRPASTVPPAPTLPRVLAAAPASQTGFEGAADPMNDEPRKLAVPAAIEALGEVKACRAENNEVLNQAILAARLDASTVLWGIPCGSGAYNATYVLYLARPDGSGVRAAPLPERVARTEGDIGGQDQWLVNPVYDARRQTLTVFPRGRGIGDCGSITTWTWTATGFALTEERFMGDCWGMTPDVWPTTWRTRP